MTDSPTILIAVAAGLLVAWALRFLQVFLRLRNRLRAALETTPDIRVAGYTLSGMRVTVSGYPLRTVLLKELFRPATVGEIFDALRAQVPAMRIPPFGLVRDRIFPVLKHTTTLPPGTGYIAENRILRVPFDEAIVVAYAIEGQFQITYVTEGMLSRWALTQDALHALALDNLRAKTEHVLAEIGGPRQEYSALDGFDAARLLVADLIIPPGVTDPLLAIPHEHALLVDEGADADALRERAVSALQGASLPLTSHLYRWTSGGPVRANGAA
ncbi:MAG TPA: hypothetical protein VFT63_00625 [bacterium]|nr:hypothetical protein [bacterium]